MLRSQNNKEDQVEEEDGEMKALIEERSNTRKEDKEQMKHVSKKIKKCIRGKRIKKARTDSANTGGAQGNQEHFEHQICEEKKTYTKDKE